MAGKLPGGLPDSPKNLRHCWPRGMFLASNICWVSSGTSSRAKQYLESTAALKGEFATWVRDGQGAVLLRPAGGQRGEARHEEVQACRGSAVVGGLSSKLNFTKPKSSHLHSRPRGKGTRLTAILRRSQFSLAAPRCGGARVI